MLYDVCIICLSLSTLNRYLVLSISVRAKNIFLWESDAPDPGRTVQWCLPSCLLAYETFVPHTYCTQVFKLTSAFFFTGANPLHYL